jgi:hypothetical protein
MRRYFLVILLLSFGVTQAHHAIDVAYDRNQLSTVTGNVKSAFWRNPHVTFEVIDDAGLTWMIESGSINSLIRAGFDNTLIKNGDRVSFLGAPSRIGLNSLAAFTVTIDGKVIPIWPQRALEIGISVRDVARESDSNLTSERTDTIFKVWARSQRFEKKIHANQLATDLRSQWDPLSDDPALLCMPPGMPSMMDNPYPIAFEDHDNYILMRLEEWDAQRVIWLIPGDAAITDPKMGLSIGQWNGSALTVTTTMINDRYFDDLGTPLGLNTKIVERFQPNEGHDVLMYAVTIDNPEYFESPATFTGQWEWVPSEKINRYDCALR